MNGDKAANAILDLISPDYIEAYNNSDDPATFVNWMLAPYKNSFDDDDFAVVVEDTHEILGNEPGNFQPSK